MQGSTSYERRLLHPSARILVLGDSTGVGVGAGDPNASLPGRLARAHPRAEIFNLSVSGACVLDVVGQIRQAAATPTAFDLVLLLVGGNEVLARRSLGQLRRDSESMLQAASRLAPRTLWIGNANVGLAPAFVPPLSWWLSARSRRVARLFASVARQAGVTFVDFHEDRPFDPFSREAAKYFAADGLHPSAAAYGHCLAVIRERTSLDDWITQSAT